MSILILSCLSQIFLYVSSISIVFLLYQELWVPQHDLQLRLPGPGGRCGDWDDPCIKCISWYNFYGHFNPETFWFLGRPVDARYDIAPMDQWHSVIPWVSEWRLSAAVSRSIFSWTQDPALFATLWRFGTRSIFTSNRRCGATARWWASCAQSLGSPSGPMTWVCTLL